VNFLARIFGRSSAGSPDSFPHSQLILPDAGAAKVLNAKRDATRRELLRHALRDTLNRQGIPTSWLTADALISTSRTGMQGVHWRLVVQHWDARLAVHAVALQQKLRHRLMTLDPMAVNWLTGISWQFSPQNESDCPSLPHPGVWTAPSTQPSSKVRSTPEPVVDVIAGPVRIPDPRGALATAEAGVRADLALLNSVRQADSQQHAEAGSKGPFARTEPMRIE